MTDGTNDRLLKALSTDDRAVKAIGTRSLLVRLTPDEMLRSGEKLAEVSADITLKHFEEKLRKDQFKEQIEDLEKDRKDLVTIIRRKSDYRDVVVHTVFDYREGKVESIRMDTFEVIDTRAMSLNERQQTLPQTNEA